MSDLDTRYAQWRATADGERVVQYVLDKALRLRERGWRHFGVAALVESARYDRALEVGPDSDGLKINNSWRAFIAREVMAKDERLEGFFEVRRAVADVTGMEVTLQPIVAWSPVGPVTEYRPGLSYKPGLRPVTVEQVPTAVRWRCVQPACGKVVTRAEYRHLEPALGGYLTGRCPNLTCWSNQRKDKQRGTSSFSPISERQEAPIL